jgi:hypothetical protein
MCNNIKVTIGVCVRNSEDLIGENIEARAIDLGNVSGVL